MTTVSNPQLFFHPAGYRTHGHNVVLCKKNCSLSFSAKAEVKLKICCRHGEDFGIIVCERMNYDEKGLKILLLN